MLVDGTRHNSASNSHNHQHLPIFRNKSSILNIFSNVGVLTFCVVFSIACLSFSNAQPYKTNVNDINWARYVAPSPVEMGQDPYIEYGDDDNSVEDGIIEEEPEQETKKNVPSAYEELDNILEDENEEQEPRENGLRHQLQTKQHSSSPTSSLTRENVPPTSDIDGPESIKSTRGLHTNFKLRVRKNQPNFQLRVRKDPNFQLRVRKSPNFQLRVRKSPNFQLRVRKSPNFQLRVRKNPNFQLRVRKSPNFQLRVRKNRNFQLRVRKRAGPSAFQLRVRKDADLESIRPNRNFQLRVRKADQAFDDDLGLRMTRTVRSPSRQAFQLRVRKAPSSSFQLRVRKDGSEDSSSHLDEEAYINSLNENELDHYAQSLPEIDLPGLLKLERKRKAGSFQLRV